LAEKRHVVIIGAGAGGLAAACDLARAGLAVTVLERAPAEGGKMRQVTAGGALIDAGPTVFTMRWVFDDLFASAGETFANQMKLLPASLLARHAWTNGGTLDLHADASASAEAIRAFAGPRDSAAYLRFIAECRAVYETLRDTFMTAPKPSAAGLVGRVGNLGAMLRTRPFDTFWQRLEATFADPRLRQLFGRYATYVGSSPFLAPATLMLIAHVEQDGVWLPEGGMRSVAGALRGLAERQGAEFRFGAHVQEIRSLRGRAASVRLADGDEIAADAIVFNGDAAALANGLLGEAPRRATEAMPRAQRSLSAVTWCLKAKTRGFALSYHNVFFADNYAKEFDAIFRQRTIPGMPTVYVCAQDRSGSKLPRGAERLLILINAPPDGDRGRFASVEEAAERVLALLSRCGVEIDGGLENAEVTTPEGFNALFPGTGGGLYGQANHSPMASFARPGAASRLPGLYLAGGSAHPGAGVPMVTLSGRLAAERVLKDFGMTR
jgi:1-hydroxycarotenoid 3,4-desaturase